MTEADLPDWADFPLFAPSGAEIPKFDNSADDGAPTDDNVSTPAALSALSHLLYDEETPEEASDLLRDEGNRHLRRGKRGTRVAIQKYTDAIHTAEGNTVATAAALANRSAAELKLGNYGRALADAEASLRMQPRQVKAHYRAATCAMKLGRVSTARQHCRMGRDCATSDVDHAAFARLVTQLDVVALRAVEREEREKVKKKTQSMARDMMAERGIRLGPRIFALQGDYASTEPCLVDGEWTWPVLLVYVTADGEEQSDYLQAVTESVRMDELVDLVFGPEQARPEWDMGGWYNESSELEIRFRRGGREWMRDDDGMFTEEERPGEDDNAGDWMSVAGQETLGQLVERKEFVVSMYPVLHVVPKWWR